MAGKAKWSLDLIQNEALKYTTRYDFQKGSSGAYGAAKRNKQLNIVCAHMPSRKASYISIKKAARKYTTKIEFKTKDGALYQAAVRAKCITDVCSHMVMKMEWDFNKVLDRALLCDSRSEFQNTESAAYTYAIRNGFLDDVCKHMSVKKVMWTNKMLIVEANKYKSKMEFQKGSGVAYQLVLRRGLSDLLCGHMQPTQRDDDMLYLWRVIGTNIYKLGVSSLRRGVDRIYEVADKNKVTAKILMVAHTQYAIKYEKELLKEFTKKQCTLKEDGFTEFRVLTESEARYIVSYIKLKADVMEIEDYQI